MQQKRVDLTDEQKKEALKLFLSSKQMEQLTQEFVKSFKVLDGRQNPGSKGDDPDYYTVWSSVLQRTVRVPASELLGQVDK